MRESILTIPVNEVFEPKCGCPICRMRDTVEAHICEYIMGAAMMEPDVRVETNKLGFCMHHFELLLLENNRLSLGLMLKSYLEVHQEEVFKNKNTAAKGLFGKKAEPHEDTCFVCSKIQWGIDHMTKTIFTLFKNEEEFRKLFAEQEYICLPHWRYLNDSACEQLRKDDLKRFSDALEQLVKSYMESLSNDVSAFCDSFDYRNAGTIHKPGMEHVKKSVPRAIHFLTGRKPKELD